MDVQSAREISADIGESSFAGVNFVTCADFNFVYSISGTGIGFSFDWDISSTDIGFSFDWGVIVSDFVFFFMWGLNLTVIGLMVGSGKDRQGYRH